jgi:hypothetical protein
MGFLKKLLKPKNAIRAAFDPAGATVALATGNDPGSLESLVDPSGMFLPSGSLTGGGGGGSGAPAAAPSDPMAGYYGDPNDPSFGSFTEPFDVPHFLQYQDPAYYFRLRQGEQGLRNAASAGSGALSGAALKDLLSFNQDMASQEYGNAFNRYQVQQGNIFSRLSDIARLGQSAAAGVGSAGTQLAGQAGQAAWQGGSAAGAGIVGAGNALGQGATNYWLYNNPQIWKGAPGAVGGV